jgi:hypothetical protein
MATQPLYQIDTPPAPLAPVARPTFSRGIAVVAVTRAMANMPVATREATLEELKLQSMTGDLLNAARAHLSPNMYAAFLTWGEEAVRFNTLLETDDELDRQSDLHDQALSALNDVKTQTTSDFCLKAYIAAVESHNLGGVLGPIDVGKRELWVHGGALLAAGFIEDVLAMSPVTRQLNEVAALAWETALPAIAWPKEIGLPIAELFAAAPPAVVPPSMEEWSEVRARMEFIQASVDGHCGAPEPEISRLCSRLVEAQIALLTTPAPTAAELAFKQKLYFEIDAHEFDEEAIGASITADVDRLMCDARQSAGAGEIDAGVGHPDADPHTAWLADRNRAQATLNAADETLTDEAADALSTYTVERDRKIANTPATTRDGVLAKLSLVAQISLEGFEPNIDWCASALVDAQRVTGIGSLVGAAEARHREMAA